MIDIIQLNRELLAGLFPGLRKRRRYPQREDARSEQAVQEAAHVRGQVLAGGPRSLTAHLYDRNLQLVHHP